MGGPTGSHCDGCLAVRSEEADLSVVAAGVDEIEPDKRGGWYESQMS